MLRVTRFISILLAIAILGISCIKGPTGATGNTGNTGPQGPQGPSYTGVISGHVTLYDQYGSKIESGYGTATLSLNGGLTTVPDGSGYYIFPNDTSGKYDITATNPGFGTTKVQNMFLLKDTLTRDIKMAAIPNFAPISVTHATSVFPAGDSLVMTFNYDMRVRSLLVLVNSNRNIDGMPANYNLAYTKTVTTHPGTTPVIPLLIPFADLYNAGFLSGTTIYFKVYGYVVNDYSLYEDFSTGKNVYTAISATAVIDSAVLP
jgi:hypothetical protein